MCTLSNSIFIKLLNISHILVYLSIASKDIAIPHELMLYPVKFVVLTVVVVMEEAVEKQVV